MPFADMPGGSSHIQGLQTPDWTRFAEQANNLIAHQPIPDYSSIVLSAANQIDQILKLSSPEEKLKRRLELQQLSFMNDVYNDYRKNPEGYTITAHGPIPKDPLVALNAAAKRARDLAQAGYYSRKGKGGGTLEFLKGFQDRLNKIKAAEANGAQIPVTGQTAEQVVPGSPSTSTEPDTDTEDAAATAESDADAANEGY